MGENCLVPHSQTAPTAHPLGARKGGQNSSIALDQTGFGTIPRVHWGPLNRTFPAPYSPCIRPERGNPLFWLPDARAPQRAKKKRLKWRQTRTSDGDGQGGCPRGPGSRGGHGPSRTHDVLRCAALNLCLRPPFYPAGAGLNHCGPFAIFE